MGIVLIMGNVGFILTTVGFEVLIVLRLQLSPCSESSFEAPCFGVGGFKNPPWTAMQHAYQIAGFMLSRLGLRKVRDQTLFLKCH